MSKERACHILNQHLGMRKLSALWVPRLLTVDQKHVRMNIFNLLLVQLRELNISVSSMLLLRVTITQRSDQAGNQCAHAFCTSTHLMLGIKLRYFVQVEKELQIMKVVNLY